MNINQILFICAYHLRFSPAGDYRSLLEANVIGLWFQEEETQDDLEIINDAIHMSGGDEGKALRAFGGRVV